MCLKTKQILPSATSKTITTRIDTISAILLMVNPFLPIITELSQADARKVLKK